MTDVSELRWYHYRDDDDWVDSYTLDDAVEYFASHCLWPGCEIPKTITIYEFGTDGFPDGDGGYELEVLKEHKVDLREWMRREEPGRGRRRRSG